MQESGAIDRAVIRGGVSGSGPRAGIDGARPGSTAAPPGAGSVETDLGRVGAGGGKTHRVMMPHAAGDRRRAVAVKQWSPPGSGGAGWSECTPPSPIPAPPASRRGRRAGRRAADEHAAAGSPAGHADADAGRFAGDTRHPPRTRSYRAAWRRQQSTTALPRRAGRGSVPVPAAERAAAQRRYDQQPATTSSPAPTTPAPCGQPAERDQPATRHPRHRPPQAPQLPAGAARQPPAALQRAVRAAGRPDRLPAGAAPAGAPPVRATRRRRPDRAANRPAQADGDQGGRVPQPRTDHPGRADLPARGDRRRCRPVRA